MSDRGQFDLTLLDASGNNWSGVARIRIENDADRVIYQREKRYASTVRFMDLRTVPRGRHLFHVKTSVHVPVSQYVTVHSEAGSENKLALRLLIDYEVADSHGHLVAFPSARQLPAQGLDGIANVLGASNERGPEVASDDVFHLRTGRDDYDRLVENRSLPDRRDIVPHRLAACLLNLYVKMQATRIPHKDLTAWDLVGSIIGIAQDRLYARVNSQLPVDEILTGLEKEPGFRNEDARHHNVPQPAGYRKHRITFKTNEDYGNLQLTFSVFGEEAKEWALDADIDEKTGCGHLLKAFYHYVTGARTNPYAVHQLLCTQGTEPPYELQTAQGRMLASPR